MISDEKTNFLYLADTLPNQYPVFWKHFKPLLEAHQIEYALLPGTNDVWCRDFMPVQTSSDRFVQFTYQPGYLQAKKYQHTISNPDEICRQLGIEPVRSGIKLDGGNVVKYGRKAIITDKIYSENTSYDRVKLRAEIQELLELEALYITPKQPGDFTGHADGMVRFLDENTILVNDFKLEADWFRKRLKGAINQTGLKTETFIYKPILQPSKEEKDSAMGTYINFLQLGNLIFLPVFDIAEDEIAVKQTKTLYPDATVVPVLSNDIAKDGGILNCISWNILK